MKAYRVQETFTNLKTVRWRLESEIYTMAALSEVKELLHSLMSPKNLMRTMFSVSVYY
jgi:hypothetical protein